MEERLQQSTVCVAKPHFFSSVVWIAGLLATVSPAAQKAVQAQVTPAAEGAGTAVRAAGNRYDISGGTQAGSNLFHTFDEFSLEDSQTANFLSDSDVSNIVGQVSTQSPSYIDGVVQVSGSDANLYLVNPAGVLFGPSAQLSLLGSFTATTADKIGFGEDWLDVTASQSDYAQLTAAPSAYRFTPSNPSAVVNQGDLAVAAGESLVLMGGAVINEGRLEASGGQIGLAAVEGNSVVYLTAPGSLLSLEVAQQDFPSETGDAFSPTDLPVLITGQPEPDTPVEATNLTVQPDGQVMLAGLPVSSDGGAVTGELSTRSQTASGGTIALLGESLSLINANIDASGSTGGAVRIGGGTQAEINLPTSESSIVSQSDLLADGLEGAGGEIVVRSQTSRLSGYISAQGATQGGFIETSADYLDIAGLDLSANGATGNGHWLIDPVDIEIVSGAAGFNQVDPSAIATNLDNGLDVEIVTTPSAIGGDITLTDSIDQTGGSSATLTLKGRRFIQNNNSTIDLASTGQLTFELNAVNPELAPDSRSIEDAITAIGNVTGRSLLSLGSGRYSFSNSILLDTSVDIEGVSASSTLLEATGPNRLFVVEAGKSVTLQDLALTTSSSIPSALVQGGIENRGSLTIRNSHFENNQALQGAAVESLFGSTLDVFDSLFVNNQSSYNGGAIFLSDTTDLSSIRNTRFQDNSAFFSGGAIYSNNSSIAIDDNTRFVENQASGRGGAIANDGIGDFTISQTSFERNTSQDGGGAIHSDATGTLILSNATFSENVSQDDGGAVDVNRGVVALIENSRFSGNRAESSTSHGGGLSVVNGASVTSVDTAFENNFSAQKGGALYLSQGSTATIAGTLSIGADSLATDATTRFVQNASDFDGGGIAAIEDSDLTVSGVLFRDNFSGDDGGGIAVTETSRATIENTNFEGNITLDHGGGLYHNNINNTLVAGTSLVLTNSRLIENQAQQSGGGFHQGLRSSSVVRDSLFRGNAAAVDGGGIHVSEGTTTVENSQIVANSARFGGGIEVSSNGTAMVTSTALIENVASFLGGGAQIDSGTTFQASNSTFERNQATEGGGLFNRGTSEITNSTFSGNLAQLIGGAIRSTGSSAVATIRHSTLTANASETAAGGISNTDSSTVNLQNTIVAGNTSPESSDVRGRFVDSGNNLIGSSEGSIGFTISALVGSAIAPLDPQLAPLGNNGGPTNTHLPLAGSIAIDAGSNASSYTVDQRGFIRLFGSATDIGAVEVEGAAPLLELPDSATIPFSVVRPSGPIFDSGLTSSRSNSASDSSTSGDARQNFDTEDANRFIRYLEQNFSQDFEDYWNLSAGPDLTFSEVQMILRRAQEEYQVNSAVVYAMFVPEEPREEKEQSAILQIESPPADSDLLTLSLVLPDGELVNYQLPVTRKEAVRQMRYFRSAVSDPADPASYRPLARQLYQWLLAPLEIDLASQNINNLMYALDAGLRSVPVAAMQDDNGFLIERYGISVIPSMGLMRADFPLPARRSTVAMGISEFETQVPLPAVPIELEVVDQFVPASQVVLNEATTLDAIKAIQTLEQPGVLHLATHASFDRRSPEDSYIQLWKEPLSMRAFSQLDWQSSDLELLILSACSTALGSRNSELGFAGLAAASGVDATMGSLWEVSDVGTLALMSEFYAQLEKTELRFEALRQAQLALLNGETRIEGGNLVTGHGEIALPDEWDLPDSAPLDHPFFWSAFTMVGNPW
ncbi:MAG: CHAT domain-containing protein [Phormidesmis sp.]